MIVKSVVLLALAAAGAAVFGVAESSASGHDQSFSQNRVVVADEICRALVLHEPDADVEFAPGIDVRGRRVAPPDLPGGAVELDGPLTVPVLVDLAKRYPEKFALHDLDLQLSVGALTIDGDDVRLNGRPLDNPVGRALAAQCAEQQ